VNKDQNQRTEFQPVNPFHSTAATHTRRNLPHLQDPAATYFVTFRCRRGIRLTPDARSVVMAAVRYWDRRRIDLDAAVVMPDHVHMIFRMRSGASLSGEMHGIKGFSASEINRLTGHRGAIWMDESFDHIVRNENEWEQKIEYVRQNPVTRGLAKVPADYQWLWVAPEISEAEITG